MKIESQSQDFSQRNIGVFLVGFATLILLWLPPLPYIFHAGSIPDPWLHWAVKLGLFKFDETWRLRWDYVGIPILFIYAMGLTWKSRVSLAESGLTGVCFASACRYLLLPTVIGVVICVLIGISTHSVTLSERFWKRLFPVPALLQQIAIQLFFHRQLYPWFGKGRKTAFILTFFFVVLHAPNPGLMLGTLVGMYFWARAYQRFPNLYAISLSHAFMSAVLMQTMPKWLLPSVSVGYRFVEKGIANQWWGWF
jgi:hypothetical protein